MPLTVCVCVCVCVQIKHADPCIVKLTAESKTVSDIAVFSLAWINWLKTRFIWKSHIN